MVVVVVVVSFGNLRLAYYGLLNWPIRGGDGEGCQDIARELNFIV